ncbi:hypothetical protein [Frateuria terrea]|uniref:Uncharacterized protein n=1 Tax=Frateuria terrea TaxID=529704 RepID=A0A1H6ZQI6_9GAMM|nr:hypothetical protein [Frateuria terrea]SEJ54946.1 hypothetical protein SAMN04487997_0177 [Frateuria terrea]SFP47531.1 hypothetical protein SAMN02927913_2213 [Frateuria terrea]
MSAAYRIPNHDGYLLAGSDCDNSAIDEAFESITDKQKREIVVSVADRFGGHDAFETLEAFADQIDTLANAHYMLDQLFTRDCSISQLMERQKAQPDRIISLRCLLNLTGQCAQAVDEATTDNAREILDGWNGEE